MVTFLWRTPMPSINGARASSMETLYSSMYVTNRVLFICYEPWVSKGIRIITLTFPLPLPAVGSWLLGKVLQIQNCEGICKFRGLWASWYRSSSHPGRVGEDWRHQSSRHTPYGLLLQARVVCRKFWLFFGFDYKLKPGYERNHCWGRVWRCQ